jgi:UDP-N-acetylmuramoyl-tripeptide--D-alanyl-D-alanine ligase
MATPIPKNNCEFTIDEIVRATEGQAFGANVVAVRGVSIDTRSLDRGALFVALRGASDGHQYLGPAARIGAAAAIVDRGRRVPEIPCIEVEDTLVALGRLARFHARRIRGARPIPSISIGGAAGKTTTKEIAAALSRAAFGPTLSTTGNLNNLIGVPMTMLTLTREHRAMVIECGTNTRGEIARLSAIVEPEVAMVLNVDLEHTEGLGSIEDIADEEASIFDCTKLAAIIPSDDRRLDRRVPATLRKVTFGAGEDATVRLLERSVTSKGRAAISLRLDSSMVARGVDPVIHAEISLIGIAAAMNCAAAVAAVAAASLSLLNREQLDAMGLALTQLEPMAGRLEVKEIGGIVVIDDSYNAQPPSVRIGLDAAREIARRLDARLVIALGDMLELGALAKPAHAVAVRDALASNPAVFVAIGVETCLAAELARPEARGCDIRQCNDSETAARLVADLVRKGDVLLVKGSRGLKTELIVEALIARAKD